MSGSPRHSPYEPRFEPTFEEDRAKLGLGGADFDHHFQKLAAALRYHPYGQSVEIPDGDGIRLQPTYESVPDLPKMCVLYRVQQDPNEIVFLALTRAWTDDDVPMF